MGMNKRKVRVGGTERENSGIKAMVNTLLASDRQFERDERQELREIEGEVASALRRSERPRASIYRGKSASDSEDELFAELMRLALVAKTEGTGLHRTQQLALLQLSELVEFVEQRGDLGPDIDPLRLLKSGLDDFFTGDRSPFFTRRAEKASTRGGPRRFPEHGRQLRYLSCIALEAMSKEAGWATGKQAQNAFAKILKESGVQQFNRGGRAARPITALLLEDWKEALAKDQFYGALKVRSRRSESWPKAKEDVLAFCRRLARRLAHVQWRMQWDSEGAPI